MILTKIAIISILLWYSLMILFFYLPVKLIGVELSISKWLWDEKCRIINEMYPNNECVNGEVDTRGINPPIEKQN